MNGIYDLYRLYGICASDLSISCQLQLVDIKKNYVHLVKQQTLPQGVRILLSQAAQTVQNGRPW